MKKAKKLSVFLLRDFNSGSAFPPSAWSTSFFSEKNTLFDDFLQRVFNPKK